jgi:hypothetical protein
MIPNVEHTTFQSDVVNATLIAQAAMHRGHLIAVPDMSGRMDRQVLVDALAQLKAEQPVIVGLGDIHDQPVLSTMEKPTTKTTYSRKGKKSKQRRNRK